MVAFIAGLNGNAEDHIGYFDTSVDDIARSLRSLSLPVEEGFRLAIQDQEIVGVLGIEADPEIGRAWIYGPLVRHPQWMAVADAAATLPPCRPSRLVSINSRCSAMAGIGTAGPLRPGTASTCSNELAIMALSRADLDRVPRATALPIDERYYDQFRDLHPRLMPNTYFTAQQLLDRLDAELASADRDARGRIAWIRVFPGRTGCFRGVHRFRRGRRDRQTARHRRSTRRGSGRITPSTSLTSTSSGSASTRRILPHYGSMKDWGFFGNER